jgi:glycosyltransferase involved in cell wall biosynthesis
MVCSRSNKHHWTIMPNHSNNDLDIAVLLPGLGVFGGVRRFLEIGNELVRRGHRYTVYHPGGARPDWIEFAGTVKPLSDLAQARHQIVICNDPPLLADFERARADLKLFYFVLENIRGEKSIARHPGWSVVANSTGMANRLWRRYRVQAAKVVGGINLEMFRPLPPVGSPRDEYRILTLGRISRRKKGVPIVVGAVESLARHLAGTGVQPKLVLFDHVGPGNERDPRDGFRCAVPHEFHINVPQDDLAQLYSSCHVFASAERRAGWANTVAEAMACGVPVVCTRSGALDLAIHRKTAWVVRRHRWFVKRGLRALYDDPGFTGRLKESALEHVRKFSWENVVDQLLAVIRERLKLTL